MLVLGPRSRLVFSLSPLAALLQQPLLDSLPPKCWIAPELKPHSYARYHGFTDHLSADDPQRSMTSPGLHLELQTLGRSTDISNSRRPKRTLDFPHPTPFHLVPVPVFSTSADRHVHLLVAQACVSGAIHSGLLVLSHLQASGKFR